jgi:hypothetical protein
MKNYYFIVLAFILFGCKAAYEPPVTTDLHNYLIVEGTINSNNSSTDSTYIKLSRTVSLQSKIGTFNPELYAQVIVEDGQNYNYTLKELGKGVYAVGPLGLDNSKKYRVRIKTGDGKVYLSELSAVTYTPPIDSIGFNLVNVGIQLYVNTHNPANNTRYYRWEFNEAWKFRTNYNSMYVTNGLAIKLRTPAQNVNVCYSNDSSTGILLGSSVKLTQDVIYQAPLNPIAGTSEKIELRYSILVKQYGLTEDAFKFWDELRKNTESLGSIFDSQPSGSSGNIHCTTDATEPVFGYISITNIQTKRVYINSTQLPSSFIPLAWSSCYLDTILDKVPSGAPYKSVRTALVPTSSSLIPITRVAFVMPPPYNDPPVDSGYYASSSLCTDCTTRGGIKKPDFWVDK